MKMRPLLLTAFALMVTACAQLGHGGRSTQADGRQGSAPAMLLSPNGEPLTGGSLGIRPCAEVMSLWFDRVDGNRDGKVDRQEFMADARIQFERMDLDRDGFITSDELSLFRTPFMEQSQARPEPYPYSSEPNKGEAPSRHSRHGSKQPDMPAGPRVSAPRMASVADPVMAADTNLDFKVSLDEFLKQAANTFDLIDADHDGVLSLVETSKRCPAEKP